MEVLKALRKITKEQKIDVLVKLISEHWVSDGDADNSSATKGAGLVFTCITVEAPVQK